MRDPLPPTESPVRSSRSGEEKGEQLASITSSRSVRTATRSPGVHAALSLLEALGSRGPLTLSELAGELAVPKSSLHRVCSVLVERGWAVRDRDGRYELGIRAIGLAARSSEFPIVSAFRGVAAPLLTKHNETVCLAVLDGEDSVYVAIEETSHPVRLVTWPGRRTPAFASASGRVILAARTPEMIAAEFAGRTMVTPTGRRLGGVTDLLQALEQTRRQGYSENHEETAVGLYTASVPIRNEAGATLAALTMCVPTSRLDPGRRATIVDDLLQAGEGLSNDVSWLPAWNAARAESGRRAENGPATPTHAIDTEEG